MMRDNSVVEIESHKLEVGGSTPSPATIVSDEVHVAASEYANKRREESISFRKRHGMEPFDLYATDDHWLAHYEGFRDACLSRQQ